MEERECAGGFAMAPLHKAAHSGDAALVSHALECTQAALDAPDSEGRTALIIAAGGGHLKVVKALAEAGAELAAVDQSGRTASQIASANGHHDVAEYLAQTEASRSALWAAVIGSSSGMGSETCVSGGRSAGMSVASGGASGKESDIMANLLRQAGLPSGPAESPF